MGIIKNFDWNALQKRKARAASTSAPVNLVERLNEISPDIAKLKVGEAAQIKIPEGMTNRKLVMSIVAPLNNLTPKGGDWEGRQYKVAADPEGYVIVLRGEDLKGNKIPVRNIGRGGGRPPKGSKSKETTPATTESTVKEGARVTEHS